MYIDDLRKYKENSYYNVEELAEKLLQLSNLQDDNGIIKSDIENALHYLKEMVQRKGTDDYIRTFYNVLLVIAGFECF